MRQFPGRLGFAVVALALWAAPAGADDFKAGAVIVSNPRAWPTLQGVKNRSGYMTIANQGQLADRLIKAESTVAQAVELHTHIKDGDVMRMRPVDAIEVPAGGTVELAPGGLHLMFVALKAPFKAGEKVPATLQFERAGKLQIEVAIEAMPQRGGGSGHHGGHK